MTDWPSTLPQAFERNGFSNALPNNILESKPEYGPPKRRRRTTTNIAPTRGTMIMTVAQWAILKTFYQVTVLETLPFTFPDPDGGSDLTVCFADAPDRSAHASPGRYRVTINLEIQP